MKATLEFQLPEEQDEHRYALAGAELASVIREVVEGMRRFEGEKLEPDEVRNMICEELIGRDLSWILG